MRLKLNELTENYLSKLDDDVESMLDELSVYIPVSHLTLNMDLLFIEICLN